MWDGSERSYLLFNLSTDQINAVQVGILRCIARLQENEMECVEFLFMKI